MNEKVAFCSENIESFASKEKSITKKLQIVGTIRVLWFLLFLIIFVYWINFRHLDLAILSFVLFVIGFGLLVILFNRLKFSQKQCQFLIKVNEQEIGRLKNDFTGLAKGEEFIVTHHPYTVDLDIFGPNSVYQLINRTATIPGSNLLADRLKGLDPPCETRLYQESVQELSKNPQFTQEYQALGMHFEINKIEYDNFNLWLGTNDSLAIVKTSRLPLYVMPAIFLIGFIITSALSLSYYFLLPVIAINLYLLGVNHSLTSKAVEQTSSVVKVLKTYLRHLRLLRENEFKSNFVCQLRDSLFVEERNAELEIQKLSRLLEHLQARNNLLHIFINIPLLLDLQWMSRLNAWKEQNQVAINSWLTSLAEFEVLVSLAGTAFMNPDWCFPTILEEDYTLSGKGFGHPLIQAENRIGNDFNLKGVGRAVIVTGPNMAGKSTFLRTIALNVILAKMGGTACADEMTVSQNLSVFTVMRTQDNLSENISSFYAELDRIQQLLAQINTGTKVLYFLDELLKGTNSADRHRGAKALVRQLIAHKVTGFVSTHDIELGELTQQFPEVSNFSFESTITDGQISFDYKIREGVCSSFNASELMRQMGIEV